jgi:hypothetical protein
MGMVMVLPVGALELACALFDSGLGLGSMMAL